MTPQDHAHSFPPAEALQEYEHGGGNAVSFATIIVGAVVVAIMIWAMVS
jgi:hypothetical protein